jgi:hypothetical protein
MPRMGFQPTSLVFELAKLDCAATVIGLKQIYNSIIIFLPACVSGPIDS